MQTTIERDEVLNGKTYKIRPTGSDHSYYVTLNAQLIEGVLRPREIFFNTKNPDHYEHLMALTRVISAIFRIAPDCYFIAKELQEVFSPVGGYRKKSKWYHSMYNEIGEKIELFLLELDALNTKTTVIAEENGLTI